MKGSPGAILAIAIGAVFLSLGWTGRYEAVWNALRTGSTDSLGSGSGSDGPSIGQDSGAPIVPGIGVSGACGEGTIELTTDYGKTWACYPREKVRNRFGGSCGTGDTRVLDRAGMGFCVNPADGTPVAVPQGTKQAGQVESPEDYASVRLPTGPFAMRYQPNVRGMFDAQ